MSIFLHGDVHFFTMFTNLTWRSHKQCGLLSFFLLAIFWLHMSFNMGYFSMHFWIYVFPYFPHFTYCDMGVLMFFGGGGQTAILHLGHNPHSYFYLVPWTNSCLWFELVSFLEFGTGFQRMVLCFAIQSSPWSFSYNSVLFCFLKKKPNDY